jgi:hypothetical protein
MKMKNLILLVLISLTSIGFAQKNEADCTKFRALTGQYAQQKMWRDAADFFIKSYHACGLEGLEQTDWNNAKIIYRKLIKVETDKNKKNELTDSLIWIFKSGDTYGNDPKWKADYATELVRAKSDDITNIDNLFGNSIHVLKEKANTSHIKYYYVHLVNKFNTSEEGETKENARNFAIEEFLVLSDYCDLANKSYIAADNASRGAYYVKSQAYLEQLFVQLANNCETLSSVLSKKITDLPIEKEAKIKKIKGYLAILDKRKCTSSDLYGQFADSLIILEPTSDAYYAQGNFFYKKKEFKKAKTYFIKAIELEGDGENVNKYKLGLANAQYASHSYKVAFKTAKSIQGEDRGKALIICANCIAATANSCGDTSYERKANYWLANDYIKRAVSAGASGLSSSKYLNRAPTSTDTFDEGKAAGQSIILKCWGESTKIR